MMENCFVSCGLLRVSGTLFQENDTAIEFFKSHCSHAAQMKSHSAPLCWGGGKTLKR